MTGNSYDGTLIAIEGIDGAGKSTVTEAISQWADDNDEDVVVTREPTDLWTGEQVYRALGDEDTPPLADFSLFVADRVKHVEERIKPALMDGKIVVTDRYADSTRAYQTHRIAEETGMSYDEARSWMETVFEPFNVAADITIYLQLDVDTALERIGVRGEGEDKYEKRENIGQVKDAYEQMYDPCDPSVRIIDARQSKTYVAHQAKNVLRGVVRKRTATSDGKTYADAVDEFTE